MENNVTFADPILIPGLNKATLKMISAQYGIGYKTLIERFKRHRDQFHYIVAPGSKEEFESMIPADVQFVYDKKRGRSINYMFTNAAYASISMNETVLLSRDDIEKLVRNDISVPEPSNKKEQKAEHEKTTEPDNKEETLLLKVAKAFESGDTMKLLTAAMALDSYRKEQIDKLSAYDHSKLDWTSRATAGKIISKLVDILGEKPCHVWDMFYYRLIHVYDIPLEMRAQKPLINGIYTHEWYKFYQVFVDICHEHYLDVNRILNELNINTNGLSIMVKY